jgi:cobalt/nickel transport system permease protein
MSGSAHGAEPEAVVETALHRAPAECKVLATVLFVLAVALVPRGDVFWPYAIDAALLLAVAAAARTSPRLLAGRLAIEAPFVLFVVLLPIVSGRAGVWLALGILCKATLAVLATGVLAWTTPAPDILRGAERLGAPRQLTAIAGFALRYLQVLLDELRRMRLARAQRGDEARWLWQAQGLGRTLGALAVRTFERGERVHAAMLARGYDGRLPALELAPRAPAVAWPLALALPVAAVAVLAAARGWL